MTTCEHAETAYEQGRDDALFDGFTIPPFDCQCAECIREYQRGWSDGLVELNLWFKGG
jgi:hypothetical protein